MHETCGFVSPQTTIKMFRKQPLSKEKALSRLAALCAKAEYCTGDMEDKMRRWGLDAEAIRKLLLNLLSNALKFTPKGGSVRVRVKTEGRFVKITVADTGKGMDSDTLTHLFDRFMDGGQDPMPPRGLGLGLPICQRIAQGHGGMIVAQSEEGKGSLFTVSLPAVKAGRVQLKDRGSDYAGGFNRTLVEMSDALSSEAFLQKYLD